MNLDYLHNFIETANRKSLSKASEKLNISQPALSKQIRKLEDYFEMPLLKRTTSGVELTDAGEVVYKRIPHILEEIKSIQNDLKQMGERRRYVIGTLPSLAGNYIPSRIIKLKEQGSEVDIIVKNTSPEVLELLKQREIDAAIIEEIPVNRAFWKKEIFVEPLYAVVHNSHQLAKRKSVSLEEISEDEFVLYPANCMIRQSISNVVQNLKVKTEVEFGEFLIGYVAAGGGVTIVPEITAKFIGHSMVKAILINNPEVNRHISIFSHSKSSGKLLYSFFKEKGLEEMMKNSSNGSAQKSKRNNNQSP